MEPLPKRLRLSINNHVSKRSYIKTPRIRHVSKSHYLHHISKMEELTDEQFELLLQDVGTGPDLDLFDSLYDPNLIPLNDSDISALLALPPLPSIEEEPSSISAAASNGRLLEEDVLDQSSSSSEPEASDALKTAIAAKRLVEAQGVKLDEMRKE